MNRIVCVCVCMLPLDLSLVKSFRSGYFSGKNLKINVLIKMEHMLPV